MEHELNHLAGLIERQHGVIEALARLPGRRGGAGDAPAVVALDVSRLSLPAERAQPHLLPVRKLPPRPERPLVAPAGLHCFSLRHRNVDTVAVPLFGCQGEELERRVEAVARRQREGLDFKPVFITDSPTLDAFTRRGYAVEHIPEGRLAADSRQGVIRRLEAIRDKWGIGDLLDLGSDGAFFCPICNSRALRLDDGDAIACAGCGAREWHRALAEWCLKSLEPGARVVCPTADAGIEALARCLELELHAIPIAGFLRPLSTVGLKADAVLLHASRQDRQLGIEPVLAAAARHLGRDDRAVVAYWGPPPDANGQRSRSEKIGRALLTRWNIGFDVQAQSSQLELVPELALLSARRGSRVELLVATKRQG